MMLEMLHYIVVAYLVYEHALDSGALVLQSIILIPSEPQ